MFIPLWFLVVAVLIGFSIAGAKTHQILFFGAIFALFFGQWFAAIVIFLISFGIYHLEVPKSER